MIIDLDKLEELMRAATPGPWEVAFEKDRIFGAEVSRPEILAPIGDEPTVTGPGMRDEDAHFIVAARNALPGIIATARWIISELEREREKMRTLRARVAEIGEGLLAEASDESDE